MNKYLAPILVFALLLTSPSSLAKTKIIYNVNGYTLTGNAQDNSGELTKFHALQINNDIIEKIYSHGEKLPNDSKIERVDGHGNTMLPGLIDAHGHVKSYGLSLMQVKLEQTISEQDAVEKAKQYQLENPTLTWIEGRGWNQVNWPDKQFPSKQLLDKYFPDTPVLLRRVDGHAIWVNSKAMEIAGVNRSTADLPGGQILKDDQGEPTGVFIDNAMSLIYKAKPKLNQDELEHVLFTAMTSLASKGLTSVHDAGIDLANITAYQALVKQNRMPIRVNAMVDVKDKNWLNTLAKGPYKSADNMLAINSVKISVDGALGSRGAALVEDYSDLPHHKGLLLYSPEQLTSVMKTAMEFGFQVNTHAIGDNANKQALDNYQTLIEQTNSKHLRHRIEHAQVLLPADIVRFKQMNIIASMQATHATSDKNMAEDRIGQHRIKSAYAWRTLLDNKIMIAAGSDFPVEYPNPFFGLHASVTRQDKDNQPNGGWYGEQRMNLQEALQSFTLNAAYAGHQEHIIGSLEVGKKADFILIKDDIFNIEPSTIWQIPVEQTWVNGETVRIK
ncbi:amidohydrolase [Thalassotalea crassostreae]|uniref:amidohydrolase n=1 Tax=Thalassotalea crassostreae TaxID=1763536 RepID=UPI000839744C|nr:amidohydrolase [Thalassotalea crassostreae]